jgi:hypothetical protein
MTRALLVISLISLAFANAANSFKFNVNFYQPTEVNGTTFQPGEAKAGVSENKIVLHQGKKMAEAPVKLETNNAKYVYTTVGYKAGTGQQLKDICIAGTTTRIVFE